MEDNFNNHCGDGNCSNVSTSHHGASNVSDDLQPGLDMYFYPGFRFENVIYTYVWPVIVLATVLHNAVVVSILLGKMKRSSTIVILAAISVSDTLTGLVTLPAYILVFQKYVSGTVAGSNHSHTDLSGLNISHLIPDYQDYIDKISSLPDADVEDIPTDGYFLSAGLCDAFMLSKFFLSKSFHTVSVWLTLFLGLQRFLLVYMPYNRRIRLLSVRCSFITCLMAFHVAPLLHCYHLFKDKSIHTGHNGPECTWSTAMGEDCDVDCVYYWMSLLLGHVLPAVALIGFTAYFVYNIRKTTNALKHLGSQRQNKNDPALKSRKGENMYASLLVIAVLVVFLIAETPHTVYLFYLAISSHSESPMSRKFNRAVHATYEINLVVSFCANFYIYLFLNMRFRREIKERVVKPLRRLVCCSPGQPVVKGMAELTTFKTEHTKSTTFSD